MNLAGVVFGCWLRRVLFLTVWGALVIAEQNCYAQAADEGQEKGKEEIEFVPVMMIDADINKLSQSTFIKDIAQSGFFPSFGDYSIDWEQLRVVAAMPKHFDDILARLDRATLDGLFSEQPFWQVYLELSLRDTPDYQKFLSGIENAPSKEIDGIRYLVPNPDVSYSPLVVAEDKRLVFMSPNYRLLKKGLPEVTEGAERLHKQAPNSDLVVVFDVDAIRSAIAAAIEGAEGQLPSEEYAELKRLEKISGVVFHANAGRTFDVGLDIECDAERDAREVLATLKSAVERFGPELPFPDWLGGKAAREELLKSLTFRQAGRHVEIRGVFAQKTLAEIDVVMQESAKIHNQRQVLIASHNFHDAYGEFPFQGVEGKHENLSWRVSMLPYLDQQSLYEQFDLSKPWDSPENKALLDKIPEVFGKDGMTNICWVKSNVRNLEGIERGTSNTICFIMSDKYVPWTQNNDLTHFEAMAMFMNLKPGEALHVHMYDGRARRITRDMPIEEFEKMLSLDED